MADTAKRLTGPAFFAATAATLYTVPGSTTTILRHIRVNNETANAASFSLAIGTDAAGKRIFGPACPIPGNGFVDWTGFLVMATAEILTGLASAASTVTYTVSGVEVV